MRGYYWKHKKSTNTSERMRRNNKRSRNKTRLEVLSHYSGGTMKCACCGESHVEFLGIDHINNDGGKFRKENPGTSIYFRLKREKYPDGYRVLCHNCNMSIGFYGYCPHNKG